ncbi:hypothetical protein [Paracidovorax avenae]|uniref:hypothetical protein n=1 Tax=Paracidovorax avenae TaxID=80867 RepID=UPI001AD84ABF|nr:hypothetical protein [Paracidovorax avenae]
MTIDETRTACKEKIEALEFWIRRLIDMRFTALYGHDYFNAVDTTGTPLFSSKVKSHAEKMLKAHPARYQRPIDTLLLEDEGKTICKFFSEFHEAFAGTAHNSEAARRLFESIAAVRNPLYHANPITLRQAEKAFCYSADILESVQKFYRKQAMAYLYDAPLIIRMSDSLGNIKHRGAGTEFHDLNLSYAKDEASYLRVGDAITVEVEVDPAYPAESYEIRWSSTRLATHEYGTGPSFQVTLTERQVSAHFDLQCTVISKNTWHRKGDRDDFMLVAYRVLPRT